MIRASIRYVDQVARRNSTRWRAFADAVALALGINVWISIVILPGFFVAAFHTSTDILLASAPLLVLTVGIWRRAELALLLLFPSALMIPVALSPELVSTQVYGPMRFVIVAIGLIAYLFGVSFFTSFYEPATPASTRALASSQRPVPARWRRRFRMYRWLALLSLIFPAIFLYKVNFHSTSRAYIDQMFPGRETQMLTVINLAAIGMWVLLYLYAFLGVLRPHRTGDRIMVADLGRLRADAKRGRLKPTFYAAVLFAVGFMGLLIFGQYL